MARGKRKASIIKPKNGVFAALGSRLSQVGKVTDISLDGLCIEFFSNEEAAETDLHIDIFTLDEKYTLFGLPCRVVHQSATKIPGFPEEPVNGFMARKCQLKYQDLNSEQWGRLAELLKDFA
jgi:hypothetical protein